MGFGPEGTGLGTAIAPPFSSSIGAGTGQWIVDSGPEGVCNTLELLKVNLTYVLIVDQNLTFWTVSRMENLRVGLGSSRRVDNK
jgi:hypothetical protein